MYSYFAPSAHRIHIFAIMKNFQSFRGARYVEAAEVRSHAAKLFEQYNYMLRLQVK